MKDSVNTQTKSHTLPASHASKSTVRLGASKRHAFLGGRRHLPQPHRRTDSRPRLRPLFRQFRCRGCVQSRFRIPNFLQNLFGEGVLSASFIPVYAHCWRAKTTKRRAARRRRRGPACAQHFDSRSDRRPGHALPDRRHRSGISGEKRELTIRIVRILFPGAGLFVFSAWCLGILNSHRRFFLSYTAPVIWNVAMIATMWGIWRPIRQFPLATLWPGALWSAAALQVAVQLPIVLRLLKGCQSLAAATPTENVRPSSAISFPSSWPRCRPDQRLRGCLAREPGLGPARSAALCLRANPFHPARQPIRNVRLGGGTAVHVRRDRQRRRNGRALRGRLRSRSPATAFFVLPSTSHFSYSGTSIAASCTQNRPIHSV